MTDGTARQANGKAPPIPKAGPLAGPRSLHQVGLPAELTRRVIPRDNPQTPEKIALGQKLFFDGRLSADGTVACATCHDPARAFTNCRRASIGIRGRVGQHNAPTILTVLTFVAAMSAEALYEAESALRSASIFDASGRFRTRENAAGVTAR